MVGVEGCENGGATSGWQHVAPAGRPGRVQRRLEHFGPDQGPSLIDKES